MGLAGTTHLGISLTTAVRPPVTDSTLDIPVRAVVPEEPPARRLVTIGDSLTHGFQHLAIFNTAESWPAMVARQLGIADQFRFPSYEGGPGGHPLNLERVADLLEKRVIQDLVPIHRYMAEVKEYYERGQGSSFPLETAPMNDNLAIWGWDLRDTLARTADTERAGIRTPRPQLIPMVGNPGERAAVTVLNSARKASGRALTPLEAARQLGEQAGGIETLCVWLGANNVLGAVVNLRVALSGPGYDDLSQKSAYTVWTVEDFTRELALVCAEVRAVRAQHVLWATVPHVTIPPVTHGIGDVLADCPRYFSYYARPWETEDTFDPNRDRYLTGLDAWAIDCIIDGYNSALEANVRQAREDGLDWHLVDLCAVLDRLAYRRNVELGASPADMTPYPLPSELAGLDTRFFTTAADGTIETGGLIGLDGVHPTTCGYGIVAQEFIDVMVKAGVPFPSGSDLDFSAIRASDTLVSNPPGHIAELLSLLARLDHELDLVKRLLPHF